MYNFVDINEQGQVDNTYPTEAMVLLDYPVTSYGGIYLEDVVPGYRTLNVQGRELLGKEIESVKSGRQNGTMFRYSSYPEREIVVKYQILAEDPSDFREAFNELNRYLNFENKPISFNDELDKYYVGTLGSVGEIDPGTNSIKGEFTIVCSDPFKYSRQSKVVELRNYIPRRTTIDYEGAVPAIPELRVAFQKPEGIADRNDYDCAYVAVSNLKNSSSLEFGNKNDEPACESPIPKIDTTFNAAGVADISGGTSIWTASKSGGTSNYYSESEGLGQSYGYIGIQDFNFSGTADSIVRLTAPISGHLSSLKNWSLQWDQVMAPFLDELSSSSGYLKVDILQQNRSIASIKLNLEPGAWDYDFEPALDDAVLPDIYGLTVEPYEAPYDLGEGPIYTSKRICKVDKVGNKYTISMQTPSGTYILKETVDFSSNTFMKNAVPDSIVITLGKKYSNRDSDDISRMGVYNVQYAELTDAQVNYTPNIFVGGDTLKLDTKEASVILENPELLRAHPDITTWAGDITYSDNMISARVDNIGEITNEWEEFRLFPGENVITTDNSGWTDINPKFYLLYREVFL